MTSLIRRLPFAHFLFPPSAPAPAKPVAAEPAAAVAVTDLAPELDALRGEAMRRLFPKLYTWWSNRWEWGVALQVYAYLAEANTVADLEARIRQVERQRHFRH